MGRVPSVLHTLSRLIFASDLRRRWYQLTSDEETHSEDGNNLLKSRNWQCVGLEV